MLPNLTVTPEKETPHILTESEDVRELTEQQVTANQLK